MNDLKNPLYCNVEELKQMKEEARSLERLEKAIQNAKEERWLQRGDIRWVLFAQAPKYKTGR
jgi:hypothetical protein